MEKISDEIQSALGKIADTMTLLLTTSRQFYKVPRWGAENIHPNTLNALIRHGLVQKKTIEVYELTQAGRYANQSGYYPKEKKDKNLLDETESSNDLQVGGDDEKAE